MSTNTQEFIRDFIARGGNYAMLNGIDQSQLDQVHAYASQLFEDGNYEGAKRYYILLISLSHRNFDYFLALGMCCQFLAQYHEAIIYFSRAGLLRIYDPRSSYFAGICYQLIGNPDMAKKAFAASLKWCAAKPEYAAIKLEILQYTNKSVLENENDEPN